MPRKSENQEIQVPGDQAYLIQYLDMRERIIEFLGGHSRRLIAEANSCRTAERACYSRAPDVRRKSTTSLWPPLSATLSGALHSPCFVVSPTISLVPSLFTLTRVIRFTTVSPLAFSGFFLDVG
jgi:hypothetical protein